MTHRTRFLTPFVGIWGHYSYWLRRVFIRFNIFIMAKLVRVVVGGYPFFLSNELSFMNSHFKNNMGTLNDKFTHPTDSG